MKHGVIQESGKFVAYVNGQMVYSARMQHHAEYQFRRAMKSQFVQPVTQKTIEPKRANFHINKRFEFLEKAVKMVASGVQASAVISGSGGLGKTYTVRKALEESGFKDITTIVASEGERVNRSKTFVVMKGYSTAKGLFRALYENNDSILVLDDCDSVQKDPVAVNLIKAAADSYETRIISWNAESRDDDLPRSFIYTGRLIFISNLPESKIDQAIRSRSALIDVSMTLDEMIDRMRTMIADSNFLPEFDDEIKQDALAFIDDHKTKMSEISLRTLITVSKVRASDSEGSWEEMAEYLTCR